MRFDKINVISLIVLFVLTAVGGYFSDVALTLYQKNQDLLIAEIVRTQASAIERRLERSLSSTRILAQEVRQNGGLFVGFNEFADEVIQTVGGISNLQLAPNGVIHSIYPLKGNERAIGHDILKDDKRKKEALLALKEKHMTLAGPFELVQGGIGMVGRNPVFLKDPVNQKERFWGYASALIYLDDLMKVTELRQYEQKGFAFELYRRHPDTGQFVTIASSQRLPIDATIQSTITVPNGEWYLRMSDPNVLPSHYRLLAFMVSAALAALVAFLIRRILLQPSVLRSVVEDQTKELKHLALHDSLTHLPNRTMLKEAVETCIAQNKRHGTPSHLLVIDLDNFKPINDLCGHEVGDAVLREIAGRLVPCTRETDTVARMGGDEFAVLLDQSGTAADAIQCIERILMEIRKPVVVAQQAHHVSASIGVVEIPTDGTEFTSLYRNADLAMYAAKSSGKNHSVFYDPRLQEEAMNRINLHKELEQALLNQELTLHLQPIVNIADGSTVSFESLMRWNHPTKGLVTPGQFIAVAEKTDIILDMGHWTIDACCQLIRSRNINVPVSVNLSPKQFGHADLVSSIRHCLKKHNVPPVLIEIELTESCFIDDFDRAIAIMHNLLELGIHISLDDFGTGFSSLTLLQRLPVKKLKIDRSFIHDLSTDTRDKQIVKGLISIAQNLDLQVVAEGIENAEQLSILREMHCNLGQGYYFSRPMPANHFFQA